MTSTTPRPRRIPMLSKSRYTTGLQCHKRLWLESYRRELEPPVSESQQALFDAGTLAGELAQQLRPGGVLIDEDYMHHREATERTRRLLGDSNVTALYEAAFIEDDIRIRADIMARVDGGAWELIEVKSATSVKEQYIDDVAVQLYVLELAGVRVERACVATINNQYVYDGVQHVVPELFTITDVTELARERLGEVPARLVEMRAALALAEEPEIDIGPHCTKPYDCQFIDYCRRNEPEWPVDSLPMIRSTKVAELRANGYRSIPSLPASMTFNAMQERVRASVLSGQPWVANDLGASLEQLTFPVHFIDFETVAPWLPRWAGTRPYQTFPFQWSDHTLHEDGRVDHAEYLAEGSDDPRREFATTLIEQLRGAATLVVYTSYEKTQLTALRDALPDLATEIDAVLALPQFDLHQVIRNGYYHPEFLGSFSLKAVLPVVVPELAYTDLTIQKGDMAALEFQRLWSDDLDPAKRQQIRDDLLAYCKRDTLAMVRLLESLRGIANGG